MFRILHGPSISLQHLERPTIHIGLSEHGTCCKFPFPFIHSRKMGLHLLTATPYFKSYVFICIHGKDMISNIKRLCTQASGKVIMIGSLQSPLSEVVFPLFYHHLPITRGQPDPLVAPGPQWSDDLAAHRDRRPPLFSRGARLESADSRGAEQSRLDPQKDESRRLMIQGLLLMMMMMTMMVMVMVMGNYVDYSYCFGSSHILSSYYIFVIILTLLHGWK